MMFEWVIVAAVIVWWVSSRGQRPASDGTSSAERILEERLARGEIDADEFRARRLAIRQGSS